MKRVLRLVGLALLMPLILGNGCTLDFGSCLLDYELGLDTLYVANADEDDFWSDGDEPYFVLIGFRMTPGVPGSADVFWSGYLDEDWADGIDAGDSESIPSQMGIVAFPDIDVLTRDEVLVDGQTPEVMGVLAFALESDATPFSRVREIFDGVVTGLEDSLNAPATGGTPTGTSDTGGSICGAANTIRTTVEDILGGFWVGVASWGDPDNVVDHHLFLFAAVTSDMEALLQASGCWTDDAKVTFGVARNYAWNVSSNPLVFTDPSEGVTYHVGGGFRMLTP